MNFIRDIAFGIYHNLPVNVGQRLFDEEWDVAIILDACRPDALREFVGEYSWLASVETRWSVGSTSTEWMNRSFDESVDLRSTGYVTGNPYSRNHAPSNRFAFVDEVWRYAWDDEKGVMPARPITDRAITAHREQSVDQMVVHYMQPHFPSIPLPLTDGKSTDEWGQDRIDIWDLVEDGDVNLDDAWSAYIDNLEYVLEDVDLLLKNLSADRVVITADHGEAFGEWGLYGHGHQPAPILRRVPWVTTSANDRHTHEPATYDRTSVETSTEEQLEALGYR